MKLTVVPEDKLIIKNGFLITELAFDAPGIHAIQWNDNKGEYEMENGENIPIESEDDLSYFVEIFDAAFDLMTAEPTVEERIKDARNKKSLEFNANRDTELTAGMQYMGYTWDSDHGTRLNLSGVIAGVAAGIPLPAGFTWRTKDNRDIPMTASELIGFGGAMMAYTNSIYKKSWKRKAALEEAVTPEEILNVPWEEE